MTSQELAEHPAKVLLEELANRIEAGPAQDTIWMSAPHNLYLVEAQARAYLSLMKDCQYSGAFHDPVRRLIAQRATSLIDELEPPIAFVDLGPGYPDKSFPVFDLLSARSIPFTYFPIDISQTFLDIAASAATQRNIHVRPVRCLFEELPSSIDRLTSGSNSRLVLLGLTAMNFSPSEIPHLLSPIVRHSDNLVVATEQLAGQTEEQLTSAYRTSKAEAFNRELLALVGLNYSDLRYFVRLNGHNIEIGFRARRDVILEGTLLPKGIQIITATSYRYSRDELAEQLRHAFRGVQIFENEARSVAIAVAHGNGALE